MKSTFKRITITCRDWLTKFSGEDFKLIHDKKVDVKVKHKFAFIGTFVVAITLISLYSSAHFIYNLFNGNLLVAIPMGIFWSAMIANIYVLLLYTITPKLLTGNSQGNKAAVLHPDQRSLLPGASVGFRIGFVVLIAIIIAQPWIITTLSANEISKNKLFQYKQEYRNNFIIHADSLLIAEENSIYENLRRQFNLTNTGRADSLNMQLAGIKLFSKISDDLFFLSESHSLEKQMKVVTNKNSKASKHQIDSLNTIMTALVANEVYTDSVFVLDTAAIVSTSPVITKLLNESKASLINIIKEKNKQYQRLDDVINRSNFYIRQVQIINSTFLQAWLMTALVVFAFIFPIYLKYRIRNTSNFYEIKQELEHRIVDDEYTIFKNQYENVLFNKYKVETEFYESYVDPPYNTRKKNVYRKFDNEKDLLSKIYVDEAESDANKYIVSDSVSI